MGTTALTRVYDGGEYVVGMRRNHDGNLSWHGFELAAFLTGREVVAGISDPLSANFNGTACLAAWLFGYFKDGIGEFYVDVPASRSMSVDCTFDYIYDLTVKNMSIYVRVTSGEKELFSGTQAGYIAWIHDMNESDIWVDAV